MPDLPHRYGKPLVKSAPPTLELTAAEVHPALAKVAEQAAAQATATEALAVMVALWGQWQAAEKDHQKALRKKSASPKTDLMLVSGQIMAIKAMITTHLQRHAHLVRFKS